MTYSCVVFSHARTRHLHRLQTLQNRYLRKITGAPWFVRNARLHVDLRVPTIGQFMKRISTRFFESAVRHRNPLVQAAAKYTPSRISRIRRPRHALIAPDDPITIEQESSRETSTLKRHINKSLINKFRPRRRGQSRRARTVNSLPVPLQEPARVAEQ